MKVSGGTKGTYRKEGRKELEGLRKISSMDGTCLFKTLKDIIVKNYVIIFYLSFTLYMFVVYVCAHTSGECAYSCKDV